MFQLLQLFGTMKANCHFARQNVAGSNFAAHPPPAREIVSTLQMIEPPDQLHADQLGFKFFEPFGVLSRSVEPNMVHGQPWLQQPEPV